MLGGPEKVPNFKITNGFGEDALYLCVFPNLSCAEGTARLGCDCFARSWETKLCVCKEMNPT